MKLGHHVCKTLPELENTTIDQGRTDHINLTHDLTLTYDLDLQLPASYGHDVYSHTKYQGQWSVGSKDIVETNGRTERQMEAIALPPSLMRKVTIHDH